MSPTHLSHEQPTLQLDYRPPLAWDALTLFLVQRGALTIGQRINGHYRRTVICDGIDGWFDACQDVANHCIRVSFAESLAGVLPELRQRLHRLFDLDADPIAINQHLRGDAMLNARLDDPPGLRIPGTPDHFELALRAILGQQITVKAASTVFSRFVDYFGRHVETPFEGLDRLAPESHIIADAPLQTIIDRGLPKRRAQTIQSLAQAMASGTLQLDDMTSAAQAHTALQALPGIGPWTAHYISMRALGDGDAFPESDLGLLRALDIDDPRELRRMAEPWRPWRAYAAMYIWQHHKGGG